MEGPLARDNWKLLDSLTDLLGQGHPRDVDTESLARQALDVVADFAGASATSIYVADFLGALRLAATSRTDQDSVLPVRIELEPQEIEPGKTDQVSESDQGFAIPCTQGAPTGPEDPKEVPPPERLDPRLSLMIAAARSSSPLFLPDVRSFRATAGLDMPEYADDLGESCIVLPLSHAGEMHGVINLANLAEPVPGNDSNTRRALLIASRLLGQTLANLHTIADISSRARRDGLTSLYNYATFYDLLAREVLRAGRYKTPLTILLMDLDGFKAINDHYGHLAGDRILSDLAARIRRAKRGPDLAARYAGDEFALVLPETHLGGAQEVAKRIRTLVADEAFAFLKTEIKATLSIGVAEYKPGMTAVDLVRRADENLYEAKRAGKNTICG